ncbi:MAG: hypothetical protein R3C11_19400 [Planctomycetaceae bacterium]
MRKASWLMLAGGSSMNACGILLPKKHMLHEVIRVRNWKPFSTKEDKSGRYVLPSMHPNWHMLFKHTPTDSSARIYRQWDEVSKLMVADMVATGTHGRIAFPAEINDIRNWLWTGFRSYPLYTIMVDFPYSIEQAESTTRQHYKKSIKNGFRFNLRKIRRM